MSRRRLIVLAVLLAASVAWGAPPPRAQQPEDSSGEVTASVKDLETALFSANLKAAAAHIGRQIFLSLKGGESGYFSANQAQFVFQDYFSVRKVVSMHIGPVADRDGARYATGTGTIRYRGAIQQVQLFVSFARLDGRWVIAQLNVY